MRLRTARKIAARVRAHRFSVDGPCPYRDEQLVAAYMRLHSSWIARCSRSPVRADGHFSLGVTEDYRRSYQIDSMHIRARYFRRGRFDGDAPENTSHRNLIRTTWVTKARRSQGRA